MFRTSLMNAIRRSGEQATLWSFTFQEMLQAKGFFKDWTKKRHLTRIALLPGISFKRFTVTHIHILIYLFFEYTHITTTYIKVNNRVSFSLEVCWKGWICPQCSPERNVFQFGSSAPWDFLVDPQGPKIVTQNWKSGCREEPTDPAATQTGT